MSDSGHSSRHHARSAGEAGRGRSRESGAPRSTRISRRSSAKSRRCGTAASCSGAIRCFPATASAPAISKPISPASWRGATGVFPTRTSSTVSAWARCAAPTARSCSARWASTPPMPGASIFRPARPISTTSGMARSTSPAASCARSRRRPAWRRRIIGSDAHWHCVYTGPAVAMIRHFARRYAGRGLARPDRGQSGRAAAAGIVRHPSGARCTAISPRRCRALSRRSSKRSSSPQP